MSMLSIKIYGQKKKKKIVAKLLTFLTPFNFYKLFDRTPLHMSCRTDKVEISVALLDAGVSINAKTERGFIDFVDFFLK